MTGILEEVFCISQFPWTKYKPFCFKNHAASLIFSGVSPYRISDYNIFAREIVMGIQYSVRFLKNLMTTSRYFNPLAELSDN